MDALGIRHLFSQPNFGGFSTDYCNPGAGRLASRWGPRAGHWDREGGAVGMVHAPCVPLISAWGRGTCAGRGLAAVLHLALQQGPGLPATLGLRPRACVPGRWHACQGCVV